MEKSFLQSSEWLEFQKSLGRKVWQVETINVIKYNLPIKKSYLYAPRCGGNFLSEQFLNKIKEIARQENSIFLKIEPQEKTDLNDSRFKKSHNIQPKKTTILDITKSEQELLSQMHYKTRYNIKLAEKRVKAQISPASPSEAGRAKSKFQTIEEFLKLIEKTSKRDKFRSHPGDYYRKMMEIPGVELFIAEYQNKVIAVNIVVFYEKIAIYLHGASDYEHRNLMAPHLLQWEQIKEAKKRGCEEYDFWGIDEKKWPGVTRFKRGFSSKEIIYPGAYDLVFQSIWYSIYKIARALLTR